MQTRYGQWLQWFYILSSELYDFFERYEDEIEDLLDDAGIALSQLVERDETWTLQEIREKATWAVVELYAYKKTNDLEELLCLNTTIM